MMERYWLFSSEEYVCDVRTVGVLVRDGKILVQRDRNGTEYALPGGHIRIGETLEEALIREYREETGADIGVQRLLWTEESFWEWGGRKYHSLGFYYLIKEQGVLQVPDNGEFVSHKDNCDVVLGWMALEELQKVTIYPGFLKAQVYDLEGPAKHFISREI